MREGVAVDGVSPETLRDYCGQFLEWGSSCRRLEAFTEDKRRRRGLVHEGFVAGIVKYLQVNKGI